MTTEQQPAVVPDVVVIAIVKVFALISRSKLLVVVLPSVSGSVTFTVIVVVPSETVTVTVLPPPPQGAFSRVTPTLSM
ncbi:hypothetical protein ES703_09094 [subsurface metagenome]